MWQPISTVVKGKDSSANPPAKKKTKTALDILLGDDDDSDRCDIDTEFDEYVLEKSLPRNFDVMAWWSVNERRLPQLAKLVKIYLGTPAMSAFSERLFSKAGIITVKQQNCLKAKNV